MNPGSLAYKERKMPAIIPYINDNASLGIYKKINYFKRSNRFLLFLMLYISP